MTWEKGQSGNPAGRPPRELTLRALLRARALKDKKALVALCWEKALAGEFEYVKFIFAYLEGMPKQAIEAEGNIILIKQIEGVSDDNVPLG